MNCKAKHITKYLDRIVDMAYVFNQIKKNNHDGRFGCNFINIYYINIFYKYGFFI